MKTAKYKVLLVASLLLFSVAIFLLQTFLFHNSEEGLFLLFQDFTFLPISVILVTLFLDKVISLREKREKLERLNILINDFFNEAGSDILLKASKFVLNLEEIKPLLHISMHWKEEDFKNAVRQVEKLKIHADIRRSDPYVLKSVLIEKKKNILVMVENPSLLEHDRFADMLWAVYHLEEELKEREEFEALPKSDIDHLKIDLERAYRFLVIEWLYFNQYIKQKYPYLFSLALRKSPFYSTGVVIWE